MMLKFESDSVSGLGPGTRANVLAQQSRSQRFYEERNQRKHVRLEQRAAAETYRQEEEAKRDCRDDPVMRRVAARKQAAEKAKRRLKRAPRQAVSTQKPLGLNALRSEERVTLSQWQHRSQAISREQQELDEKRKIIRREQLERRSWEKETAPRRVANPSLFNLDDALAVVAPAFQREEASSTRLQEHTDHAAAISAILTTAAEGTAAHGSSDGPQKLRQNIVTQLEHPPVELTVGKAPAGGGVSAARGLGNPYKPTIRTPAPASEPVYYEPAAAYAGSWPGRVFKRGDRGVGYYACPLAPREAPSEKAPAATDAVTRERRRVDGAVDTDASDAVLEKLKAKLRRDIDNAATDEVKVPGMGMSLVGMGVAKPSVGMNTTAADKPSEDAFLRALAAAADAAAPGDSEQPSPHTNKRRPVDVHLPASPTTIAAPPIHWSPEPAPAVSSSDSDKPSEDAFRRALAAAETAAEATAVDSAPLIISATAPPVAFKTAASPVAALKTTPSPTTTPLSSPSRRVVVGMPTVSPISPTLAASLAAAEADLDAALEDD